MGMFERGQDSDHMWNLEFGMGGKELPAYKCCVDMMSGLRNSAVKWQIDTVKD